MKESGRLTPQAWIEACFFMLMFRQGGCALEQIWCANRSLGAAGDLCAAGYGWNADELSSAHMDRCKGIIGVDRLSFAR